MMFAAGFGTRMGALTAQRPKPLVTVGGKALIDHALDLVTDYGAENITVNLHYLPDQIEAHLRGCNIAFSREEPDILDTGGGLRAALPLLGRDPLFTMNTDAVWRGPNPLQLLADSWIASDMDALLLCIPPAQAQGHKGKGDFLIEGNGAVIRGPGLIYSGLQIIKTDRLADIPERVFSLNLLWDVMLTQGRLRIVEYPGQWCDVGQPESIAIAENMLRGADV